ncbi:hypothetical protein [Dactylosporangium sp. CA-092794]|uniref:hypothetical protein n=1 Tax=Dactylosporangium sp. CA-092794 TaxID=3239929 RepID=UPI003D8D18B5
MGTMMRRGDWRLAAAGVAVAAALSLGGCGSGDDDSTSATGGAPATAGAESTTDGAAEATTPPAKPSKRSRAAVTLPATLRTRSIVSMEQDQGKPQWLAGDRQRVADASWKFSSGTFVFATTDVRTDLYPLRGTYRAAGTTVSFSGQGSATNTVGSASATMEGELDLSTGSLTFTWSTSSGQGAVVNGQNFASASASMYHGEVVVR